MTSSHAPFTGTFIGIVTVLYRSDEVLPDFFASLAAQSDPSLRQRVYVIDNSPDDSGTRLSKRLAADHGVDAVCLFNNHNGGVAAGNNQGIELALKDGCDYVLLANNDTEFGPGTLAALLQPMREGESATTPKLFYPGTERLIWYAGGSINAWTMRTPHWGMLEKDVGQFDSVRYPGYAPTCFLLVDSSLFRKIGLMDERYFVYYDDTDFIWRMQEVGIRIRMVPSAEVVHKVATSTGGARSPFTVYYSNRNRIYFIRKHLHGVQRVVAIAYTLATRIPSALALPRPVAARLWAGVRDGLRLAIGSHER